MLKLQEISKSYQIGEFSQDALDKITIEFRSSEFAAVLGPSGCGKTTLLNVIGGLDHQDKGDMFINGKSTKDFTDQEWDMYRNNSIGFVFQSHNLIPHLSVLQNVEMGLSLSGISSAESKKRAKEVLEKVGLIDHIHKRPNQLSGGQSQRVAIARALANNPDVILADEPTGSLDSETSLQILDLIKEIAKDKLVIMVTHDSELAYKYASRIIKLKDGQVIDDSNPIQNIKEAGKKLVFKKTAMSFKTAFVSSINNIRTKLGRTLLTAFAGSIGIIGIALILSLSNGLDKQIKNFEQDTLAGYPISVTSSKFDLEKLRNNPEEDLTEFPDQDYATAFNENRIQSLLETQDITDNYLTYVQDYVDGEGQNTLAGVKYERYVNMSLFTGSGSVYGALYSSSIDDSSGSGNPNGFSFFTLLPDGGVYNDNYDLIYGNYPVNDLADGKAQVVLVVDEYNRIFTSTLKILGFDTDNNDKFNFSDIVPDNPADAKKFYLSIGQYDQFVSAVPQDSIEITISGIVRVKSDSNVQLLYNGLGYTSDILDYIYTNYPDQVGGVKGIYLYPNNFDDKEAVKQYLDNFKTVYPNDPDIEYVDQAATFTSLVGGVIDTISIVLIAFAAISLFVSSIMISIITYISVLERIKEIGVLRSLGARKKDISRVFNSENIIIGFVAGVFGIAISLLLIIPINKIIERIADIPNVAQLAPLHVFVLISISIVLAYIAGYIPARMASKKDPVIALRTE